MSLPVILRADATRDVEQTRDYLEAQQVGLGQVFLGRLNEMLARIRAMPAMYGVIWRDVRAARVKRSTHVVYYRVHADHVEVLAVMQGGRDAAAWQSRA